MRWLGLMYQKDVEMINLSKQNILDHVDVIKECYVQSSGGVKETIQLLAQKDIGMSKTSFYRLLQAISFFDIPEVAEIKNRFEKVSNFLRYEVNTEQKTIDEIVLAVTGCGLNYNQWDVYSLLRRLGLRYKKKDLSKKVYTQSKRVVSKYTSEVVALGQILSGGEVLSDKELSIKLYNKGFKDAGNPHPVWRIRHMRLNLALVKSPRGRDEIEKFVQDKNWRLISVLDTKENDLSVKGKELELECSNGHRRKSNLSRFVQNQRCKECVLEKKRKEYEEKVSLYFSKYNASLVGVGGKPQEFLAVCSKGHEFYVVFGNYKKHQSCTVCYKERRGFSKAEKEVVTFIKSFYSGEVLEQQKSLIWPLEVDIYLPELQLAIEYHGIYYHSYHPDKPKKDSRAKFKTEYDAERYHRRKMEACLAKGVRLISIFEDEWVFHEDICKSKIRSLLGSSERKYARKLEVKELGKVETKEFMLRNHLQGFKGCKVSFGLVDQDGVLYSCMTLSGLSRAHTAKVPTIEISRFASALGFNVAGGFSKILKVATQWAKNNGYAKIKTHCDLRWGTGNVYAQTGFRKVSETKWTPHYVKRLIRHRNQSLRKTKEERATGKTEKVLRFEQGYSIIYDCGHSAWEKDIE